jgi:hypothetical protein
MRALTLVAAKFIFDQFNIQTAAVIAVCSYSSRTQIDSSRYKLQATSMDEKTKLAVILGILIPSGIIIFILVLIWIVRKIVNWRLYNQRGYNQVQHDLDDEEIEFQRILEKKTHDYDDYEELLRDNKGGKNSLRSRKKTDLEANFENEDEDEDADFEDFEFSAKERDKLSILEKFRSNLVTKFETENSLQNQLPDSENNSSTGQHGIGEESVKKLNSPQRHVKIEDDNNSYNHIPEASSEENHQLEE